MQTYALQCATHQRPVPTGLEGAGGPGRSARGRRRGLVQTNFARNFRRSFFETAQKRCNSNGVISMFEQVARELRAKLMGERPVGQQAGHLASRAGRRPRRSTAPQPGPTAPGTPVGPRSNTRQRVGRLPAPHPSSTPGLSTAVNQPQSINQHSLRRQRLRGADLRGPAAGQPGGDERGHDGDDAHADQL